MKLLGWMHRNFRQNSGDALKDLSTRPTCSYLSVSGGALTEELHQLSPALPARLNGRPIRGRHLSTDEPLLFDGLFMIGTLGSAPIEEEAAESESESESESDAGLKELATAVAAAVEAIAEKAETEAATETDLMVVNTELEKVLTEAAEQEGDSRLSSARPSRVSNSKANEACPLQEFLFGAAVEKERKEKRTSLGDLFMIQEGISRGKGGEGEEEVKKEKGAGVNVMVKTMLKRRGSHRSPRSSVSAADTVKDADTVKIGKFQKIMQIFHRKIHPENKAASEKPAAKYSKCNSKYTTSCTGSNCLNGGGGDPMRAPSVRACRKGNKCGLDQTSLSLDGSDSTSSREHWIKTDADYLVLEL